MTHEPAPEPFRALADMFIVARHERSVLLADLETAVRLIGKLLNAPDHYDREEAETFLERTRLKLYGCEPMIGRE